MKLVKVFKRLHELKCCVKRFDAIFLQETHTENEAENNLTQQRKYFSHGILEELLVIIIKPGSNYKINMIDSDIERRYI